MSLTVNFTATQTAGSPSEINFTDTSTGTDVAVTKRRIYITDCYGNHLVQSGTSIEYEAWNDFPATTTITLNVLTKDYSVRITVQWLDVNNAVLYDKTRDYGFTLYNETFDYSLTKLFSSNPEHLGDNDFFAEKNELRTCIDSGNQAIDLADDSYAAQQCYDRATNIRLNSVYIFNTNS